MTPERAQPDIAPAVEPTPAALPIGSAAGLAGLAGRLDRAPWIALDTEADSLHSYPQKVCLLQLSIPGEDALVDPLAPLDLAPLWAALAGRELVLHGSDYDLRMLFRTYGFTPTAVFDTMLAARLLGLRELGLAALLEGYLGVRLDKGSQKANWARRPLTERMLAYARSDTRHLYPLAWELRERLKALDRLEWHRQLCGQLVRDCTQPAPADPGEPWRIGGVNRLTRRGQAIARELWRWRESEAIAANRPPFFVLPHQALIAAAERVDHGASPRTATPGALSPRRREAFRGAIERALALPESVWPHPVRQRGTRLNLSQKHRLDRLEQRRNRCAANLGLDPALIASRSTLVLLAHDWNRHAPALLEWQRRLLEAPGSAA
jgi:ribonuclease D